MSKKKFTVGQSVWITRSYGKPERAVLQQPDEREEYIRLREPAYPSHIDHHDDPGSEEQGQGR